QGRRGTVDDQRGLVLRAGPGLYGLGAPRPQPHRPRAREEDVPPGRDGPAHDQVAVGEGTRAGDHGARGRAVVSHAEAQLHAGAEVTLWAVDYGVLSLTGYRTPDVRASVWVDKALQVLTEDSRQNIISRRVLVSKGGDEGGGGGAEGGPGTPVRKDFRVLAF